MTNESISGFLNSIAEAKRAFDAEPDYQRRLREADMQITGLRDTVASRELRIHELKQNEESLTQKLRSVEAERDDAGFRALEETDKVSALLTLVHGVIGDALKAVSAIEGTEQIIVTKQSLNDQNAELFNLRNELADTTNQLRQVKDDMRFAQEQLQRPFAVGHDTEQSTLTASGTGETNSEKDPYGWRDTTEEWRKPSEATSAIGQGQSEVDPTLTSSSASAPVADSGIGTQEGQSDGPFAETTLAFQSPPASSVTAEPSTDVALSASPPERNRDESTRFKDRKYYDVTYLVPLNEWLLKGGTQDDYYWRPLPEVSRASHQS